MSMEIDTYKFIEEILKNRNVEDINITFSNGESLIVQKK